jgi:dihydrofolate synthase / folylpolyglutamate synthase
MFKEAVRILMTANNARKTITREIETFRRLIEKLDHPERHFRSVHITGTNGKGSVAIKTAYILEKAGYKTGLYTSPHLFSFLERIKVNRRNIDERFFSESILKIH